MSRLYIRNGTVVTEQAAFHGGIVVEDGKIAQLVHGNPDLPAQEMLNVDHQLIMPGLVDPHVHFSEPRPDAYEGFLTGTSAAAAGGITSVVEMPLNASPPTINAHHLARKQAVVEANAVIDVGLWGGLVENNLADLPGLSAGGVLAFKAFMSDSASDFARSDDDIIYAGLRYAAEHDTVIGVHCESEYITRLLKQELQAAGRVDLAAWPESRPPWQELEAIDRALHLAQASGGRLHVVHVSQGEGIRKILRARESGVQVTNETCPQYLLFDESDYLRIGPDAKCAPVIRPRELVEDLWTAVLAGQVDVIASDHSPCLPNQKAGAADNVWNIWGGISGVQTMLPGLLTEGVHRRGLSLSALVRMMSANPARIFGLYPRKGSLLPGADADIAIVDLDREWTLTTDMLFYQNKHSAFIGYQFKGAVTQTFVRGQTVYLDGRIMAKPGYGQLLRA
ncbi:MAG: allantoinase AllB [Anaerolineales bacterium]|nr:allantoinase AllB [Anaerolineales bacterium]